MLSTNAVFSAMGFDENAAFQSSTFENICIEEQNLLRLMSLRMVSTHGSCTETIVWGNQDVNASKIIDNIAFNNSQLAATPYKQSTLYGNSGGVIKNVSYFNLTVNNAVVPDVASFISRIDAVGLLRDGETSNITLDSGMRRNNGVSRLK